MSPSERSHLVLETRALAGHIARQMYRSHIYPVLRDAIGDLDDVIQVGQLALLCAARTYNPERGEWRHYAAAAVRNSILRTARRLRTVSTVQLPEEIIDPALDLGDPTEGLETALAQLSAPERSVVAMLFGLGDQSPHTQASAARALGLSPYQIRSTWEAARDKLKALLDPTVDG